MAKLKAPEGSTGCSHDGKEYEVDKDGLVDVPDEAVADLLPHGYVPAPVPKKK